MFSYSGMRKIHIPKADNANLLLPCVLDELRSS